MAKEKSINFASPEYEFEEADLSWLNSNNDLMRDSGLYSGKALAKQSPIQRAGRSSLKGGSSKSTSIQRHSASHSQHWGEALSPQHSRPSTNQQMRPAVSPLQRERTGDFRAHTVSSTRPDQEMFAQTLQMDNVGSNTFSAAKIHEADRTAFFRRRLEDSCAHFAEQKHNMRNFEGSVHPLRDPLNRQPPKTGYTYSRVKKDHIELTPYDYDETEAIQRHIGYAVGHVRNMTRTVEDEFGRTRPATVGSRNHLAMKTENDSVSSTAHLHRYDLITMPKDTRFDSFTVRNEWNKDYYRKCEASQQRRAHKQQLKKEQSEREDLSKKTRDAIHEFEENLKAISSKKM
mmetsp:Transcript_27474/g.36021  ORF Transcript_27474/g.36021 Transcript_27474/m.36021 type:complete len:345 (+) Transcript_27474:261-1295(+)|eukprot:CAMPEP_0117740314 /NCGR_PEP_ID=MMETSP0947-20121206/4270_1 /TAXON_ID=44440 /ORGANISM="Chattonella subsalsa, Strain CCMP2191" /LENGTH=344 /DNA_ID=CAMNT_0005556409 /DNA_START=252 /DNA_END=1286 /DNA_ORIENTATION=-